MLLVMCHMWNIHVTMTNTAMFSLPYFTIEPGMLFHFMCVRGGGGVTHVYMFCRDGLQQSIRELKLRKEELGGLVFAKGTQKISQP